MALHMATWRKNAEMITVLLEAGADIEAQLQDGRRPLHIACSDDSVLADQTLGDPDAAVLALIQAGAQLEVSDAASRFNHDGPRDGARPAFTRPRVRSAMRWAIRLLGVLFVLGVQLPRSGCSSSEGPLLLVDIYRRTMIVHSTCVEPC